MKFELGQKVRVKADSEEGSVLSVHMDATGTRYTISSVEVDLAAKKLLEGIKTCSEDELEAVEDLPIEPTVESSPEAQNEQ